ncbi:putative uncharacterized protein encoded by RBM12B-AS1 [Nycticebus coucang]|uniref:putative uncharacterized protein encoded by RBM12B-AS1 n=1 Tax=Nycticebus coucang TaxID=9470 RepID=UPI00234D9168|nr:putative uncharacterized protein encoded by RBM12B-AS1 [Nycticebus coucang]
MVKIKTKSMTTQSLRGTANEDESTRHRVSHNIHHPQQDHPKALILQPKAFVHTPRNQSFLLSCQAKVATRDPMLLPDLQPQSSFKLTWTAQPPRLSVTPSQGHTFHSNWPQGELPPNLTQNTFALLEPNELGLQHLSATRLR